MKNPDSELLKIKQSLTKIIKEVIEEETKPCFRIYKAKVTSAPNGSKIGVKLIGQETTMNLPYSTNVRNATVGNIVWVATIYNSFSNALVWETVDFK